LCDLTRSFEASRPGSFRSFVVFLDNEYDVGEQSDAPLLEQQAGGVQLITVHKAKGLEFPVVILAAMTTHATRRDGCERYVDGQKNLCAQKLCGWAPWELRDHQAEEQAEDVAESVRIAYVAATRARDLLIVSASGAGPWPESWLTPLYGELYPADRERWRAADEYVPLLTKGTETVLDFPAAKQGAVSVKPGMHRTAGGNRVFWLDPKMLPPTRTEVSGLHRGEMLDEGNRGAEQAGVAAWEQWRTSREKLVSSAAHKSVRVVQASKIRDDREVASIPFTRVELEWEGQRPATRKFGRLAHAILEAWDLASIDSIAALQGRRMGASEAEICAAAEVARATMAHPELNPKGAVETHREYPVSVTLQSGEIVEGVADLAWSDGRSWTVVDYKTGLIEKQHKVQVQLYALALARATGLPARAILLEV
jgi:ATP-dependent helicase/nuclease subunit A